MSPGPTFSAGRFFKFIAGANLRDTAKIETLATVFALAGAALIDVAAEPEVVEAAKRGCNRARGWLEAPPTWLLELNGPGFSPLPEPIVMVSMTLSGDRHTEIAVVDLDGCVRCDLCTPVCPPASIINGDVEVPICTGCGLCLPVCPPQVIRLAARSTNPDLANCWDAGARALEIHTGAAAAVEVSDIRGLAYDWQKQGGLLSYSIDGQQLGHHRALALANELGEAGIIIQADGKPISGTVGDRSTIPALRLARAISRSGSPAWIQPAGGTNDRTGRLANHHGIPIAGVGMGSFARRVARALEEGDVSPPAWRQAVQDARTLVHSIG